MATATEVLDTYADLIRRLRHPSGYMADFMAFHMNRDLAHGKKASQFYPVMASWPGGQITDEQGAEFARFTGISLVGAPVYQVTEGMCEAIEAMFGKTIAEADPVIYEASLPAAAGFAWLDKPMPLDTEDGLTNPIQAMSWSSQNALSDTGTFPTLRVTLWTLASETQRDDGSSSSAEEIADIQQWLGLLTLHHSDLYLVNKTMGGPAPRSALAIVAYLNMLWMMLQMEITGIDRAAAPRGARRRALRDTGQGDVLVITLRRPARGDRAEPPGEHRVVDWSHRWLVQTHYRHHVAPPADRKHQVIPTADKRRCAVCGVEVSYVAPYIKGPEGMPLMVRRRIHRLSR